jgi:hypothetical protein
LSCIDKHSFHVDDTSVSAGCRYTIGARFVRETHAGEGQWPMIVGDRLAAGARLRQCGSWPHSSPRAVNRYGDAVVQSSLSGA